MVYNRCLLGIYLDKYLTGIYIGFLRFPAVKYCKVIYVIDKELLST